MCQDTQKKENPYPTGMQKDKTLSIKAFVNTTWRKQPSQ